MEILRNKVLLACNENSTFRRGHNGRGAAYDLVDSKWSKHVEVVTVQHSMCSGRVNIF